MARLKNPRKWSKARRAAFRLEHISRHGQEPPVKTAKRGRVADTPVDTQKVEAQAQATAQNTRSVVESDVVFPPRTEEEKITALVSQVSKRTVNHVASVVFRALDEAFAKIYKGE